MLKRIKSATNHLLRQKCSCGVNRWKNKKAKEGVAQANTCSGAVWAGSSCPIQQPGRARLVAGWQGSLSHPSPAMASPARPQDRTLHNPAGALRENGPCTCGFHMKLMPSVVSTGRIRQGALVLEGCNKRWRSRHQLAGITHHAGALSPFLLAEYNLLRFSLK